MLRIVAKQNFSRKAWICLNWFKNFVAGKARIHCWEMLGIIVLIVFSDTLFTSAADIVSGIYSMLSRTSSVRRPSVNFFSENQVVSLIFFPIFPIFGLNVHSNVAQNWGIIFWYFVSIFFLILIAIILSLSNFDERQKCKNWDFIDISVIFSKCL